MNTMEKAARQALEALNCALDAYVNASTAVEKSKSAITAIRAALDQTIAPAVPDGYKLVSVEQLAEWKSLANEAAARGLPTERHQVAQKLEQEIADVINAAPETAAPTPILEDLKELFKKSGKPKLLTGPCGQCGDTKHPCFCSTVDANVEGGAT